MEEVLKQLFGYLHGMWLYRWWGLLLAWIVGVVGATNIYLMPDRYQSSARVYVDTQSVLKPLMSGLAIQPNLDQQISILSRTLISRPNVEKLIRMADLDLNIRNDKDREALISRLMGTLSIRGAGGDNLYTLSYMDREAERARRVVQSLVTMFVESGLGDKRKDTDSARRFIEEQIKIYEQKLEEAENRLKDFRLRNLALFGSGKENYVGQLAAASDELNQARLQLREAEFSREALQRQLVGEEPVLLPEKPVSSDVSIPEIDGRIDTLKRNLDGMLLKFTDIHPDVVGARRVIEQLEAQKAELIAERMKAPKGSNYGSLNANPVYQQMKLAAGEAEAKVAGLRARVAEYESRYQNLKAKSELGPQIEAEYAQLNRDYGVHKRNYDALVSRRESASMSVDMEATAGMAEFRLIDPPSLPTKPAAPNRPLLMALAGVASIAAGVVLSFLLSQLRPTFQDARVLREVTGLPLLGSVSLVPDPRRRSAERRSLMLFAGAATSFVGGFAALAVLMTLMRSG